MNQQTKNNIIFSTKIILPIVIVIGLFLSGVNAGIITFQPPRTITGEITATIVINFGDGMIYTNILNMDNSTVFDLLLEVDKIGDIIVETHEESGSYEIESITYKGKKYTHGEDGYWWLFYVNEQFAQDSADKVYLNNNDLIEWKYEKF
jgi:hypothetical protein